MMEKILLRYVGKATIEFFKFLRKF